MNYQQAKIYKVVSNHTDFVYIGSTKDTLTSRMSKHLYELASFNKGIRKCYCTSFELLKYDDAKIELVENFPCDDRKSLHQREGYYIKQFKTVNKVQSGRTKKEYYQEHKEIALQRRKNRYEQKNAEIKKWQQKKHDCPCGGKYTNGGKSGHVKSQKHQAWLSEQV